MTSRWVRSPVAPKMTKAQFSGFLCSCGSCVTSRLSSLLNSGLAFRLRCGLWLRLLVAAKTGTHRRENLFGEGMVLARAEAGEQRRGQHFRRHRFVDRRVHGPASLAGIFHEAGIFRQRRAVG